MTREELYELIKPLQKHMRDVRAMAALEVITHEDGRVETKAILTPDLEEALLQGTRAIQYLVDKYGPCVTNQEDNQHDKNH